MILIKYMIEALPIYSTLLVVIPRSVLYKIRSLYSNFLWQGSGQEKGIHLGSWKKLTLPKEQGGWGLKDGLIFGQALE